MHQCQGKGKGPVELLYRLLKTFLYFPLIPRSIQKVVLCSGKHYYALLKQRETSAANQNTALIRVEELCPFPLEALQQELKKYPSAKGTCGVFHASALMEALFSLYKTPGLFTDELNDIRYKGSL